MTLIINIDFWYIGLDKIFQKSLIFDKIANDSKNKMFKFLVLHENCTFLSKVISNFSNILNKIVKEKYVLRMLILLCFLMFLIKFSY